MRIKDASRTPRPQPIKDMRAPKEPMPVESKVFDRTIFSGIPKGQLTPPVQEALGALLSEVQSLREKLKSATERVSALEKTADRDPLLDILNRRAFYRELARVISIAERYDFNTSLLFADLDGLKALNDAHGHRAGDQALLHVTELLSANIRQADILGRLGGDEFGILLAQADEPAARAKADELMRLVDGAPFIIGNEKLHTSLTIGAVELKKGWSADQALDNADAAMYEAKKQRV